MIVVYLIYCYFFIQECIDVLKKSYENPRANWFLKVPFAEKRLFILKQLVFHILRGTLVHN